MVWSGSIHCWSMTFIDWLNDNSGAVQAFLAMALLMTTVVYAVYSGRLVSETRKMRLDEDRPHLLVDIPEQTEIEWKHSVDQSDPEQAYPQSLVCRIVNAGRGPGKEIALRAEHEAMSYRQVVKDFLAPGEEWQVTITAFPAARELSERPPGWASLMRELTGGKYETPVYDCGIVVTCRDMHDRNWLTYLKLGLASTMTSGVVASRTLLKEELRTLPVKTRQP